MNEPLCRFYRASLLALLLSLPAAVAVAEGEDVSFWVVAGGGGASGSGELQVAGTIGQFAVGHSLNGNLAVIGGFWHSASLSLSPVEDPANDLPVASQLMSPYPNPFNPSARIGFALAAPGPVEVRIYDARGQVVRYLVNEDYSSGRHEVVWDGKDGQGGNAPSGVYFVRFKAADAIGTKKITLLK